MTTTQPQPQLACFSCGTRTAADQCPLCGGLTGEVISQYGDQQALSDGVLVAVTDTDRCTRTLFEDLAQWLPDDQPPNRWPIDLLTWCRGKQDGPTRAMSACKGLCATSKLAVSQAEGSAVKRWFILANREKDRLAVPVIRTLIEHEPTEDQQPSATTIWLLPNERGGVTMMYPSDY